MILIIGFLVLVLVALIYLYTKPKRSRNSILGTEPEAATFERWLRENPGTENTFVHCGRVWRTSSVIPPAIICPICRKSVLSQQYKRG